MSEIQTNTHAPRAATIQDGGDVFFRKAADWQRQPLLPPASAPARAPFAAASNSIPDPQILSLLEPLAPNNVSELLPTNHTRALAELARDLQSELESHTDTPATQRAALQDVSHVLAGIRRLLDEANIRRIQLIAC